MTAHGIVIAGAGQAGFQTAASLRGGGYTGPITLLGDEPGLPYQRPPLSKAYLEHGADDRLVLRKPHFFAKHGIGIEADCRIDAIDRSRQAVMLADGRRITYDHLVLALGARNRGLSIAGTDLGRVIELRTLAHARHIREQLAAAHRVVIIGGGFIGLEFATAAHKRGCATTIVEAGDRLMARAVCDTISAHYLAAHRQAGVDVRLGAKVSHIIGNAEGRAAGVALADGQTLDADLVLIATGVVPNSELAAAAGLSADNGILVDEILLTGDPAVSAVGDCAAFVHRASGKRIRLESVQNAADQAKYVAARILGSAQPYDTVAWFWSDQYGGKLQIAGLTAGADEQVAHRSINGKGLIVDCFCGSTYLGTESVDAPAEHIAARKLLGLQPPVDKRTITEFEHDLRALAGSFLKNERA
ncbi:NAD(P)/FAD-dependent oxidoreductase [Salinisphaera aquimarina]|uniref:NAD(P)/FAD-dependent oxidoreductase n=1 Tax=Salinisphaera aquimarina TaxID=2094031 RepID=A0ABV7EPX5_9GAMM